ncbi:MULTISPECIES: transcriptional regulator [Bacillus]|uniref:Transcriptional regulator n=1 Tax=Bacillus glycinifermentans TaxID=1664069 RepID=A0AAJ3Z198_9BACI|nr:MULTISPECIES: transcriptional regulator [Bacillus]KKB75311.1 XRE family transcriptional regulator [Bacillus sp. TH008]MBU8785586.1 helix-turn-helix domain-containing protein [Bacillus glycinifermentans]MDU0070711.1 helix-turn-helix domain-containing protein [Bacillus sp. IG6]MED8018575.1 helix-turn-helix domain-containing protein [Bacillus glycinifermentans]NUJ15906.1 helix-turn-helix domain-containing protein [Bacillus glycinifermentans]
MTNFGSHLRQLRERKKLTVNQLAMYSGVSSAGISRIENGKRGVPKPATIRKLADALKIPYEELMASAGYISASTVQESRSSYDTIHDVVSRHGLENLSLFDSEKWKLLSKKDIENLDKYFDFLVQEAKSRDGKS